MASSCQFLRRLCWDIRIRIWSFRLEIIVVVVDSLSQNVVAVGDELVPGLKEAEELDSAVAFPLDHRVVLNHHCVCVHTLQNIVCP